MIDDDARLPAEVFRAVRAVQATFERAGLSGEAVVVAVSGGGDSMALLELTSLLASRFSLALHVACVDHGTRPETRDEVEGVRRASSRVGACFHEARLEPVRTDEDALRRARHAALEAVARQAGARFILLGHNRDDQVETILFRFLRGAGFGGLSGMREERAPFLRPLLALSRAELRAVLRGRGVEWFEDPGNHSRRNARGRLRIEVMPAIEAAFGRGALDHLLDVAPRWRADEEWLDEEGRRVFAYAARRAGGRVELDGPALAEAHPALVARALRHWLVMSAGHEPASRELAGVEALVRGTRADAGVDVAGARVERAGERLRIVPRMRQGSGSQGSDGAS